MSMYKLKFSALIFLIVIIKLCLVIHLTNNLSGPITSSESVPESVSPQEEGLKVLSPKEIDDILQNVSMRSPYQILFLTHKRFKLLEQVIDSFFSQPEARSFDISISLDDIDSRVAVKDLLGKYLSKYEWSRGRMRLLTFDDHLKGGSLASNERKCTDHMVFALQEVFKGSTEFGVVVEEDLLLAPDFLEMMIVGSKAMKMDPSLFCISGFGESVLNGTEPVLQRVKGFPGCGWGTSAEQAKAFYQPSFWARYRNWDWTLHTHMEENNLHCLKSPLSRTHHLGHHGIHVDDNTAFDKMPFANSPSGSHTFDSIINSLIDGPSPTRP